MDLKAQYLEPSKGRDIFNGTQYNPVFALAEKLDVPLHLHPAAPAADISKISFSGNYPTDIAGRLGTNALGWHVDVGLHVLRLFSAGLFERFPKLKLIMGHNGEDLPMFIDRIDSYSLRNGTTFDKVLNTNIWVTNSAVFTVQAFQQLRPVTPIERIMYLVDYPFSSMEDGWKFAQNLVGSNILNDGEMDMFAHGNAEALLRL